MKKEGWFPLLFCEGVCLYRSFYPYDTEFEAALMGYWIWRDIFNASYPHAQIYVVFSTDVFGYVA